MRTELIVKWGVRLLWAAMPFTVGPSLADLLDGASRPVQVVGSTGLWAAWAAGMVATAVALPVSLTVLRVLAPAGLVVAVWSAVAGDNASASILAIGWATVVAAWIFSPPLGALCVNGPAYPNERRFLLRVPAAMLFGPLGVVWALALAGVAVGPLLLAAEQWVLGGFVTVVGAALAYVLFRGIHDLSRRWVVFVPAGIVLHDPVTITDPVLLRRQSIVRVGPAVTGTDALDLSQKAPGLALAIDLSEEAELTRMRPGRREGEPVKATALIVTPTRPGALLEEAGRRRLPVRKAGSA
ncbi:MAG: hypothetical protein ACRD12_08765 [Acidimicrobiales bacterium]